MPMFVSLKRWSANQWYWLIFETCTKLLHHAILERTKNKIRACIHIGSWHETLNLLHASSVKGYILWHLTWIKTKSNVKELLRVCSTNWKTPLINSFFDKWMYKISWTYHINCLNMIYNLKTKWKMVL